MDTFPSLSETFILNQITGLIDLGHQVTIFAGSRPSDREEHPDVQTYDLLAHTYYHNEKPRSKGVRFMRALWLFLTHFHKNPRAILRSLNFWKYGQEALALTYFYKVILFVSCGTFDILQCHFGPNGNVGALLKELGISGRLVSMFHGYDIRKGLQQGGQIYQKLFEQGDCFLSISSYNKEHLLKWGVDEAKIIFHPVGIDLRRFVFRRRPQTAENRPIRLVSVARFVKEKGISDGLKAIYHLVRDKGRRDLEYHLIGDGPLQEELAELAKRYHLRDYLRFWGAQDQDGVIRILQQADIYFLPSRAEALPVVLMEAMAVGLPVVATDVGSVAQLVSDGKTGVLVPAGDPWAMAQKLDWLMAHPSCWRAMGEKARALIETHYDISQLNKRLVEIYQGL